MNDKVIDWKKTTKKSIKKIICFIYRNIYKEIKLNSFIYIMTWNYSFLFFVCKLYNLRSVRMLHILTPCVVFSFFRWLCCSPLSLPRLHLYCESRTVTKQNDFKLWHSTRIKTIQITWSLIPFPFILPFIKYIQD